MKGIVMGFGDKLKGLRNQAQQAVAENKDKIQDAVQVVGEAANNKTHGKYAMKIAQVGEKVTGSVDKFADGTDAPAATDPAPTGEHTPDVHETDESSAPIAHEPVNPVTPSAADEAASGFPEFD